MDEVKAPLISVIVPVYKAEAYLDKCVASVLEQSFGDFELILVDDGSPDNCPTMCDEWSCRDARIRVIHKQNGGMSDARNAGIDIARGIWIHFIDSDDFVHPRILEILLDCATRENADIAESDRLRLTEEEEDCFTVPEINDYSISACGREEALETIYKIGPPSISPCFKLYRRSLFDRVRFEYGRTHEDELITHQLLAEIDRIAYTDAQLYYYIQHKNASVMRAKFNLHRLDILYVMEDRMKCAERLGYKRFLYQTEGAWGRELLYLYGMLCRELPQEHEQQDKLYTMLRDNRRKFYNNQLFGGKYSLMLRLLLLSRPIGTALLIRMIK